MLHRFLIYLLQTKIKKPAHGHTFNEDTRNSVVLVNISFESSIGVEVMFNDCSFLNINFTVE